MEPEKWIAEPTKFSSLFYFAKSTKKMFNITKKIANLAKKMLYLNKFVEISKNISLISHK